MHVTTNYLYALCMVANYLNYFFPLNPVANNSPSPLTFVLVSETVFDLDSMYTLSIKRIDEILAPPYYKQSRYGNRLSVNELVGRYFKGINCSQFRP